MKHISRIVFLVVFSYGLLELTAFALYGVTEQEFFSFGKLASTRSRLASRATEERFDHTSQPRQLTLSPHPYLGYVYHPDELNRSLSHGGLLVSEYGFVDNKNPIMKRSSERLIIGFFGGSVAFWQSRLGENALIGELKDQRFAGREIVIIRTALGGFKQPQQLMTLAYLSSLGAQFDIIVNLDGFNELVEPILNNLPQGVDPFYPDYWKSIVGTELGSTLRGLEGRVAHQSDRRAWIASIAEKTPFRQSIAANFSWLTVDRYLESKLFGVHAELLGQQEELKRAAFHIRGPGRRFEDQAQTLGALSDVWAESSMQMHRLSTANGSLYLHFLQPNQYSIQSKVFSEEERMNAVDRNLPLVPVIERGYPMLSQRGTTLKQAGVHFFDLSHVFAGTQETVYNDTCCHMNETGCAIIAGEIARAIRVHFSEPHAG